MVADLRGVAADPSTSIAAKAEATSAGFVPVEPRHATGARQRRAGTPPEYRLLVVGLGGLREVFPLGTTVAVTGVVIATGCSPPGRRRRGALLSAR